MGYVARGKQTSITVGSPLLQSISVGTVSADRGASNITLPALQPVKYAFLDFTCSIVRNEFAGVNYINGNQYMQIKENGAGAYTDALLIPDGSFYRGASAYYSGIYIFGSINVASAVNTAITNGTVLNCQWHNSLALQNALDYYDGHYVLRLMGGW